MYGGSPCTPPKAVPNLFHVIKDIFGNKNPDGSKKFYTTPAPGGWNSKWRPELVGGHTNFFPMLVKSSHLSEASVHPLLWSGWEGEGAECGQPGAQNNKLGDPSFYRGGGSRCFYRSDEKIFVNEAWELFNPRNWRDFFNIEKNNRDVT